ncbi:MAG: hypothetical protein ACFB9N_10740 [Geitlerinemataceae cyanobacterium]
MTTRDRLLQELATLPDTALPQVLDFIQTLNIHLEAEEDQRDRAGAIAALQGSEREGTIAWENLVAGL